VTSAVHDRMPLILDSDAYDLWARPRNDEFGCGVRTAEAFDARLMWCYPVSTHVKNVANDDEACSKPVELVRFRIGSSHKGRRGVIGVIVCRERRWTPTGAIRARKLVRSTR
jgi:hypothetical protein